MNIYNSKIINKYDIYWRNKSWGYKDVKDYNRVFIYYIFVTILCYVNQEKQKGYLANIIDAITLITKYNYY